MRRPPEENPPGQHATRYSLFELMILTFCSAVTFVLMSWGLSWLGISFLLTAIAFRTSLVDFTPVGGWAVFLTLVFGTMSIALLICWSAGV